MDGGAELGGGVRDELLVVGIDHMRDSGPYIRRLGAWCRQLNIRAILLLTARDRGIHFLAYGRQADRECQVSFVKQ